MSKLYKGIDISYYQGDVDYEKVKNSGIDFIMIKAGQGRTVPSYFISNFSVPAVHRCLILPKRGAWRQAATICDYVNKLSEELIPPEELMKDSNP